MRGLVFAEVIWRRRRVHPPAQKQATIVRISISPPVLGNGLPSAVLANQQRLGHRAARRRRLACEIRDRAGDPEQPPRDPGREVEPLDGPPEQLEGVGIGAHECVETSVGNGRVGAHAARLLERSRPGDAFSHGRARRPVRRPIQDAPRHFADRDHEIDPIDQRSRESPPIARERCVVAATIAAGRAVIAAGAGVGGGDELELRRELAGEIRARDPDDALLDDLAQGFEAAPIELRQLVEEQHAVVGERDLAWPDRVAAAEQTGGAGGVVGRSKGRPVGNRRFGGEDAGRIENAEGLESLLVSQRRQESRQAPGQQGSSTWSPTPGKPLTMARSLCSKLSKVPT